MAFVLLLLFLLPVSYAQNDVQILNNFVRQFRVKPLSTLARRPILAELGAKLFIDQRLSGKGNISCHSCHSLVGFTGDMLPLGVGEGATGLAYYRQQGQGVVLARNTPPLFNLGYNEITHLFWDGRVMRHPQGGWLTPEPGINGMNPQFRELAVTLDTLLAVQALFPIANPAEMLGKESTLSPKEAWDKATDRIFNGPMGGLYTQLFRSAYPGVTKFNIGHIANALAEFQRQKFLANNTPWDNFLRGNSSSLTPRMVKGANLFFGKASCINCHIGDHFTRFSNFLNIGVPQLGPGVSGGDDKGRFEVTKNGKDIYRFRVPPLRNVALTGPYMHSGAFKTLWEVIDHYNDSSRTFDAFSWEPRLQPYNDLLVLDTNPANQHNRVRSLSGGINRSMGLTTEEKKDLFCFLTGALTDLQFLHTRAFKGVVNEVTDCLSGSRL